MRAQAFLEGGRPPSIPKLPCPNSLSGSGFPSLFHPGVFGVGGLSSIPFLWFLRFPCLPAELWEPSKLLESSVCGLIPSVASSTSSIPGFLFRSGDVSCLPFQLPAFPCLMTGALAAPGFCVILVWLPEGFPIDFADAAALGSCRAFWGALTRFPSGSLVPSSPLRCPPELEDLNGVSMYSCVQSPH